MQRAVRDGILNLEAIEENVRMQERTKILKRHCYNVWQGKTTGHWYTYLPAPDKKNGRVQRERKTREEIEDLIVDFYLNDVGGESKYTRVSSSCETIESLFPVWLQYKADKNAAGSYLHKIYNHWTKYYLDDEIIKKDIRDLTSIDLEVWAYQLIKSYDLTKTEYYNITVIMRQILIMAVDMHYIAESPFKIKMDSKNFRKVQKKADETQVFLITEQPAIEEVCWQKFKKSPVFVSSLGILLFFRTGIRVGELVALKEEDILDDYIHVQREEVAVYDLENVNGTLKPVYHGTEIVNHAKTDAGNRYVQLTPQAKYILSCIMESNRLYGNYDDGFLFVKGNKRILSNSVIKRLYDLCDYAGVPRKSTHKIRKTFISGLIDGGMNINTIRKTAGHEKEATTYSNYCFDRRPSNVIAGQFESILDRPDFANQTNQTNQNQSRIN